MKRFINESLLRGYQQDSSQIYNLESDSNYRQVWEKEAKEDPVCSVAASYSKREEKVDDLPLDKLLQKIPVFYQDFKENAYYENVFEFGPGFGRIPLYLCKKKNIEVGHYVGVDISHQMLKLFGIYNQKFNGWKKTTLIRQEGTSFPVESNSVDLLICNAVLLHMNKEVVVETLKEFNRIAASGCEIHLLGNFPNIWATGNFPSNCLSFVRGRDSNYQKYYSLSEIERLLYNHFPRGKFKIVPTRFGVVRQQFKLIKKLNHLLDEKFKQQKNVSAFTKKYLTFAYSAHGFCE